MDELPSGPGYGQRVGVTLSPFLAREVAWSLRIQLAWEFDRPFERPLATREDAARLRMVLDTYVEQLEALAWGDPPDEVRMSAPRLLLESIAKDLLDGGNERLANPARWDTREAQRVRRQALRMIRAAEAINDALGSVTQYQLAS
jgi:hypothetical protein